MYALNMDGQEDGDLDNIGSKGAMERMCSKCKRRCLGHAGPYGKECTMSESSDAEQHRHTEAEARESRDLTHMLMGGVMTQLLEQMASLNMGLQGIMQGQADLKSSWQVAWSSHKQYASASQAAPAVDSSPRISHVHKNWNSAYKYGSAVKQVLLYDVQKGRKAGPFNFPPFETFVGSPLEAFPRKRSNKYRVIHDLSWPPGNP